MLVWQGGKQPGETEDFDLDWTLRLAGDTIVTSTWSITSGDTGASGTLTINTSSFTNTISKVWLSGGNLGVNYTLLNQVTTAAGDTLDELVQLPVRPAPPPSLTTLSNAMQFLGASQDTNGFIARGMAAISSQIQAWLGYQVVQASYSRTFNGQGGYKLFVPDIPLVSVQSLTINGQTIPAGAWSGSSQMPGYYNDDAAIFVVGYSFCRGFQNIRASYTAGYNPVPAEIEQACLDWLKMIYASGQIPTIGANVNKISAGDTTIQMAGNSSVTDPTKIPLPPIIVSALMNYKRVVGF
jgi:hypothetical protein